MWPVGWWGRGGVRRRRDSGLCRRRVSGRLAEQAVKSGLGQCMNHNRRGLTGKGSHSPVRRRNGFSRLPPAILQRLCDTPESRQPHCFLNHEILDSCLMLSQWTAQIALSCSDVRSRYIHGPSTYTPCRCTHQLGSCWIITATGIPRSLDCRRNYTTDLCRLCHRLCSSRDSSASSATSPAGP